jgi:hypothetical protein
MKIPSGYIKNSPETTYLKLEKALYGGDTVDFFPDISFAQTSKSQRC